MPTNTNDSSLLNSFYQVPAKTLGEFNITQDKIYTQTLSDDNNQLIDVNFGALAKLSAVPQASVNQIGGVRLYTNSDQTGYKIYEENKVYPVQLTSIDGNDGVAFVQVPWLNTTYIPDDRAGEGTNCLCTEWKEQPTNINGGQWYIGIKNVHASVLLGVGDMVVDDPDKGSENYAQLSCVSAVITIPLDEKILSAMKAAEESLSIHNQQNDNDFADVNNNLSTLSVDLSTNYYRTTETSSDYELYTQFIGLSDDFEAYLNNTLFQGIHTNPSYLSNETSSYEELEIMFESLSDAVDAEYIHNHTAYLTNETSSKVELKNMFDTKQNNLTVNSNIEDGAVYSDNDIATVNAICDFIKSRLEQFDAVFQGYFSSLASVPDYPDAEEYTSPPPDKNDYIYVNVTEDEIHTPGFNFDTTNDPVGVWRMKIAADSWDPTKLKTNWRPEYKLSETAFTKAQIAAMNSGITAQRVKQIMPYNELSAALINQFPNMIAHLGALSKLDYIEDNITGSGEPGQLAAFDKTNEIVGIDFSPKREKWIFELQDGERKVEKYILTQDVVPEV